LGDFLEKKIAFKPMNIFVYLPIKTYKYTLLSNSVN